MAAQLDNFPLDAFRAVLDIRPEQQGFIRRYLDCSDSVQSVVRSMFAVLEHDQTTEGDRQRAITTIMEFLLLNLGEGPGTYGADAATNESESAERHEQVERRPVLPILQWDQRESHEATFAERLRQILEEKNLTQYELAERIGCTQSAVSKMLSRNARPQRKTIVKMAQALNINPTDLWPNLEVAAILDSVSDFFEDHELTTEQANALEAASSRKPAEVKSRALPSRKRT